MLPRFCVKVTVQAPIATNTSLPRRGNTQEFAAGVQCFARIAVAKIKDDSNITRKLNTYSITLWQYKGLIDSTYRIVHGSNKYNISEVISVDDYQHAIELRATKQ